MAQQGVLDANFQAMIQHFQSIKQSAYENRTNNNPVPWFRPPTSKWNGDLQTEQGLIALHRAFETNQAERALIKSFQPDKGNSSDGTSLSLQIEYAAQAERAYRARVYQPFHRCIAHYAAREKGHGEPGGALGIAISYINSVIQEGAS